MLYKLLIIIGLNSIFGGHLSAQEQKIPFQTVKGYFLKNNINSTRFSIKKILSKKEMDSFFGMAAFMGAEASHRLLILTNNL